MTRKDARRVARYHARHRGCREFTERTVGFWGADIWQGHFEADLREVKAANADRVAAVGEEARIAAFLTDGLTVRYAAGTRAERGSER